MSLDPTANLQVFSPTNSGRSSPSPRAARNTTEEALLKKDKNFRRYAAGVERALALWDTAQQEWADYISFLGRLLKALQMHPTETPVIPHSDTVATRLAQCLNPTLPSGVHQKALEVYAYVFSTIGKDSLSRDLNLYFPGLATVLSFASLSVRPLFLSLLENYVLQLNGTALRPALKAIILSVLPGLEEETSEDFERMVQALYRLQEAVKSHSDEIGDAKSEGGSSHYWQCFFLATITNASRRQGALAFLQRRLPKFGVQTRAPVSTKKSAALEPLSAEAESAISPEPGLLIRCFEAGLSDSQLLIQRGFLDLLVTHLPLDSPVLQQRINKEDLDRLVAAAAGVVSRRDMSLNRRLWAWFLGPEPPAGGEGSEALTSPTNDKNALDTSSHHAAYFSQFGQRSLTRSIMRMIKRPSALPVERARPFRVCLSLMDRWEVGGLIVPDIFLPALQSVQFYGETASNEQLDEVVRSASIFFDGVESGLIWGKLIDLITSAFYSKSLSQKDALQNIKLAKFILTRFNLKEEEMLIHHMPLAILAILVTLRKKARSQEVQKGAGEIFDIAYDVTETLAQFIPNRALNGEDIEQANDNIGFEISGDEILRKIESFYNESHGNLEFSDPPFKSLQLGQLILRESGLLFSASLQSSPVATPAEISSKVLSSIISKLQSLKALDEIDILSIIQNVLAVDTPDSRELLPFAHLLSSTSILVALEASLAPDSPISLAQIPEVIHPLVDSFWQYLSPFMPKYHVEAVRCIWQLHAITAQSRMVEAAISSIIVQNAPSTQSARSTADSNVGRHFAVLWTHTMYELSLQTERRSSASRRSSGIGAPSLSPVGGFQAVLTRPLLLLLDSLAEEGTELFAFMRNWLQDLPSLNRVFELLAVHLQSLNCLQRNESLTPAQASRKQGSNSHADDTKECLYYMKHVLHILKRPSQYTWMTLAEDPAPKIHPDDEERFSFQQWISRTCLTALLLTGKYSNEPEAPHLEELRRTSVSIIIEVYHSPFALSLQSMEMEVPLMAQLRTANPSLQSLLLDAILAALKLRLFTPLTDRASASDQKSTGRSRLSLVIDRSAQEESESQSVLPPPQLVECLKYGFSSPTSRLVLDDWVKFLVEVLPLFADTIFENLLPLVECFCKQINQAFEQMKANFKNPFSNVQISPESTLISLINGLEQILAKAHDRLVLQEAKSTANKSPEQPQGFFGNMVSGVFSSETNQSRTPTANSRLTVLLCFQDTVRICFSIWSWGGYGTKENRQDPSSVASFGYTSLRMRNRARRILEHLFAAEALECLETLAVLWSHSAQDDVRATAIVGLLNVLNGSKPRHTIPAIFNALYSRTNPNALEPNRMSTLTSDLTDIDLVSFLVEYTRSLEDDAMDEIWSDCVLFLRDVLGNPLPHRQILPALLDFTAVIGQKVDNTNFGEDRRMRKDLADIFTRLLTAVFTTRTLGFLSEPAHVSAVEKTLTNGSHGQKRATDVVAILTSIVPNLPLVLVDNDRIANVVANISANVIGPTFRAKTFPENVSHSILDLLYQLARVAQTNKAWKKDVFDAFNDPRFFSMPLTLVKSSWLPILAQWTHSDKDRLLELLSRLSAPTTAGIMFGVGGTSARQEADRKTQLTLRRVSLLILAAAEDAFTPNLPQIIEKIVELLTATPQSSPSSVTRSELLVLLRALILKTSSVHLAPLWPVINGELTSALSSLLPDAENKEAYNNAGIIQACKLLDELVTLDPDDFQLMEWLFITDTIDAVYKPAEWIATSLTDEISEILSASETPTSKPPPSYAVSSQQNQQEGKRTLLLDSLIDAVEKEENAKVEDMARRELEYRIVRPFLGQLAMWNFESTYGGGQVDWDGVWESCVADARGME